MSTYKQEPNNFSLFKNENKTKENHPDYTGTMTNASGKKFNLAAWVNEAKSTGIKYLGGEITEIKPPNQTKPKNPPKEDTSFSDDLPF